MHDPFRYSFSTSLGRKLTRFLAKQERARTAPLPAGRPMASFTFDDVPDSAHANGAAVLDRLGAKGTFYVASGICGARDVHWRVIGEAEVADLDRRGHEIGCHTFNHVNVHTLGPRELAFECDRNRANLSRILGRDFVPTSFCYPYGDLGVRQKRILQERFLTCRSIYEGLNLDVVDLGMVLVAECFDATLTAQKLARIVAQAARPGAWLVFYTHDVSEDPTFMGCTPGLLGRAVEAVQAAGFDIVTMGEAAVRMGLDRPQAARAA